MNFTKMQGLGNDYVYINGFIENIKEPEKLAIKMSNRNFGIGSDGLILVLPSDVADCKMRMFNSDGSESEMCGNGIRCVGKFFHDKNINDKKGSDSITVETLAGIKMLYFIKDSDGNVDKVRVNMGKPILNPKDIPVIFDKDIAKDLVLTAYDKNFSFTCVSMGNPHAVTFVDNVDDIDIDKYGEALESNPVFPNKSNIEFIEVVNDTHIKMRVYERGSRETLACGTGTCASVVASSIHNLTKRENVRVELLGGDMLVDYAGDGNVYMTGEARFVYEGKWLL